MQKRRRGKKLLTGGVTKAVSCEGGNYLKERGGKGEKESIFTEGKRLKIQGRGRLGSAFDFCK